jgi:hypothetical protein
MRRYLAAAGLLALMTGLLWVIFVTPLGENSGVTIMAGLLFAGLCIALAVLLLKRDDWHADKDWWRSYVDRDSTDDDL